MPEPIDPKYLAFVAGLKEIAKDEPSRRHHRWDHGGGKWWVFDPAKWLMEDVGIPDTSPGAALFDTSWGQGNPNWSVIDSLLPDLFQRVATAYAFHKRRYPKIWLVWGPWGGGDWRVGWERVPPVIDPPIDTGGISARCRERIEWVRDAIRRGYVTHDVGQRMINDIVAECT